MAWFSSLVWLFSPMWQGSLFGLRANKSAYYNGKIQKIVKGDLGNSLSYEGDLHGQRMIAGWKSDWASEHSPDNACNADGCFNPNFTILKPLVIIAFLNPTLEC